MISMMMLSSLGLGFGLGGCKNEKERRQLLVEALEENLGLVRAMLGRQEEHRLKGICRGVYYMFVSVEIWTGMRGEVLDRKMEELEDLQFEDKPQAKPATKQQKQIRIHSLRKQAQQNNKLKQPRQPSNIKDKKLALSTLNNQLPFRSTQVGFKRLLRPAGRQRAEKAKQNDFLSDLLEVDCERGELVIDVKAPWAVNVQRAAKICAIVKRWNQFHHGITGQLREPENELPGLIKKWIAIDRKITEYQKAFEKEPHSTLLVQLSGSNQQLLIDQQLNRVGKVFLVNHTLLIKLSKVLQPLISKAHETGLTLSRKRVGQVETWQLEYLSSIDEAVEEFVRIFKTAPQTNNLLSKTLMQVLDELLVDWMGFEVQIKGREVSFSSIDVGSICGRSEFFQVLFETLQSCISGLLKLGEGQEVLGTSILINKFKNLKLISHHLWNIAKYYTKLNKQLNSRDKKGNKSAIIRDFLRTEEQRRTGGLLDWRAPQRVEKEVAQLRQRVGGLKGLMQAQ